MVRFLITQETLDQVVGLRSEGWKYADIVKATGVSLGWANQICKKEISPNNNTRQSKPSCPQGVNNKKKRQFLGIQKKPRRCPVADRISTRKVIQLFEKLKSYKLVHQTLIGEGLHSNYDTIREIIKKHSPIDDHQKAQRPKKILIHHLDEDEKRGHDDMTKRDSEKEQLIDSTESGHKTIPK